MQNAQPARRESGFGTIDWDLFFDEHPHGVIPLVTSARSSKALHQCSVLVVESLFTREADAPRRAAFLDILANVIPPPDAPPDLVETSKDRLVEIFHHIKADRKARAQAYADEKAQIEAQAAAAAEAERRVVTPEPGFDVDDDFINSFDPDADTTAYIGASSAKAVESDKQGDGEAPPAFDTSLSLADLMDEDDPKHLFADLFWETIKERLDALRLGARREEMEKVRKPVPFLLSEDFVAHFGRIVVKDIAPDVAAMSKTITRTARLYEGDERIAKMREEIADSRNRPILWEAWQLAWKKRTRQSEPPPKPKPQPKAGPLGFLKGKKAAVPATGMTEEQWQAAVKKTKADNKKATEIWAAILAPSDLYEPPIEEDSEFLMEMYGRSLTALNKQITALRQIAEQGGEVGRAFDTFRRGKHPDLAVLAVSFRYPDLFITGREKPLRSMLRGYRGADLRKCMPLTARFLKDYLQQPPDPSDP